MRTKVVEDKAQMQTILDGCKSDLEMLVEEMRTWADNMSGTALENTMKYEQVDECASSLEDAQSSLEDVELSEEFKTKEVSYKYTLPTSKYVGRSWRAGQISSALQALSDSLPDEADHKDDLASVADELTNIEFPGMY